MPDVVIENPVINSPFEEPKRHFYFSDEGITDKIVESRRLSSYFVPIPPARKKSGKEQLVLETEWTRDRQKENKFIAVYDLSATPFFLNGSGYRANELFPWLVSDLSLIDAIESGILP